MEVSDEKLASVLRRYAGLVEPVLDDPERWLGVDDGDRAGAAPAPRRAVRAVGRRLLGDTPPASPDWAALSPSRRSQWWVQRIGVVAGLAAAAPRYAGALADRLPLQAGLGSAAAGLAVCAVAREHGRTGPEEWVPLLAQVLFDRKLPPGAGSAPSAGPQAQEEPDGNDEDDDQPADGSVRRATRTLWRLARTFGAISSLFDERPRGNILARGVAKVPVIGVAGGWVDEHGAIYKAGEQTMKLVTS